MIIAFHAEGRQSGKDTAGRFLADWADDNGIPYERRAFGDKMKLLVARTLGIEAPRGSTSFSDEELIRIVDFFKFHGTIQVYSGSKRMYEISGRDFIINLAGDSDDTGARGLFGANFWVDQCLPPPPTKWHGPAPYDGRVVGITDLRFDVEADRVHELGGAVVKIDREGTEKGRSEQGIDPAKIDYHIDNNKSLDDLHVAVWRIAGQEWQSR